jgi:3-isopropylmalate dehydrogenase
MMLRWSFDMEAEAATLEKAIERVLDGGMRTADIYAEGTARVSTTTMGDAVIRQLDRAV